MIGMVLCHASVNILNDYVDFKSGVDLKTMKTPFSGGSGILPAGKMSANQAKWYGIILFLLAVPIGVYFSMVVGWQLIFVLALGAICILMYTPFILKVYFPEWSPGMGLGILPVLGAYFVQTGFYSVHALIASVPSGILVLNLLLLNEFNDIEADKTANRRTLPITAGPRKAAIVYSTLTLIMYLWIVTAVIFRLMPIYTLLALLTLPFGIKAMKGSFSHKEMDKIMPAMGSNVVMVLLTQLLIGVGYLLATFIK
jgi:1,4-dihydroxy-2-naphthoate octaprenyltransferase